MTNTQTQPTNERPSDEVTTKVVAKWKDMHPVVLGTHGDLKGVFHNQERYLPTQVADPRTDTNAALELLWFVMDERLSAVLFLDYLNDKGQEPAWHVTGMHRSWLLPASGEPFRHAVVRLAAQCLGVEGD